MAKTTMHGLHYIIELLDHEWPTTGDGQKIISDNYVSEGTALSAKIITIFVTPDLLSMHPFEGRTRVFTVELDTPNTEIDYSNIVVNLSVTVSACEYCTAPVEVQKRLVSAARDSVNEFAIAKSISGRYTIVTSGGQVIEKGRV